MFTVFHEIYLLILCHYPILQAQPSPTTGKFALEQLGNTSGGSVSAATDKSRYNSAADVASESFVFKPRGELSSYISNAKNNVRFSKLVHVEALH